MGNTSGIDPAPGFSAFPHRDGEADVPQTWSPWSRGKLCLQQPQHEPFELRWITLRFVGEVATETLSNFANGGAKILHVPFPLSAAQNFWNN